MVTIIDYKLRKAKNGTGFLALVVQGGIEMIQSEETGNYYASAKKTSIPCTFNEQTCQDLIGTQLNGKVEKESCPEYEYTVEETGEIITLSHRYSYKKELDITNDKPSPSKEKLQEDMYLQTESM